jgi:hypothetical protein
MLQLKVSDINELQGKAPGAIGADFDNLQASLRSGHLFGSFQKSQRDTLWSNACEVSRQSLIPSLYTFFEDRKFLACAEACMRTIMDLSARETITTHLTTLFTDANQSKDKCIIQTSETSFKEIPGDIEQRLELGIRQLWIRCFRQCRIVPKRSALANSRLKVDEIATFDIACLASKLGFQSQRIFHIIQHPPEIPNCEHPAQCPRRGNGQPKRYGIPYDTDHERDSLDMFLPELSEKNVSTYNLSSLFVRRSVYSAYFGYHQISATAFQETHLNIRSIRQALDVDSIFSVYSASDYGQNGPETPVINAVEAVNEHPSHTDFATSAEPTTLLSSDEERPTLTLRQSAESPKHLLQTQERLERSEKPRDRVTRFDFAQYSHRNIQFPHTQQEPEIQFEIHSKSGKGIEYKQKNRSDAQQEAETYVRQGYYLFDSNNQNLAASNFLKKIKDGTVVVKAIKPF